MGEAPLVQESTPEPLPIQDSKKTASGWGSPQVWASVAVMVGLFLLPACGNGSLTEAERASAEPSIYAAVARQLVEFDNTFGPGYRFSHILIMDRLDPLAGDAMNQGQSSRLLTEEQRQAIVAAIDHLGPIEFIDDWSQFVREAVLEPVIPGSVIITLAPADFDDEGATVGANLWCGGVCGLWLTYRVVEGPDGWTTAGREGTWAIS